MGKRIFSKIRYVLLFLLVLGIPTITGADWTAMESGTTYALRGV